MEEELAEISSCPLWARAPLPLALEGSPFGFGQTSVSAGLCRVSYTVHVSVRGVSVRPSGGPSSHGNSRVRTALSFSFSRPPSCLTASLSALCFYFWPRALFSSLLTPFSSWGFTVNLTQCS